MEEGPVLCGVGVLPPDRCSESVLADHGESASKEYLCMVYASVLGSRLLPSLSSCPDSSQCWTVIWKCEMK